LQLTQIIADKEKKSSSYKESKLDSLSDEKVAKIKKFAKEYIAKVLHKLEKSGKKCNGSALSMAPTHVASSTSAQTPNSHGEADGADAVMAEMTVEEAMDLEEDDSGGDEDGEDEHQEPDQSSPAPEDVHGGLKNEAMEWIETSDPRPRHTEESINGWDRSTAPGGSALSVGS
jgi:[histone H3]-lysine36 N-trimethyltransferase